jgi:asparagine synthase (glutamine-hydrolysing)
VSAIAGIVRFDGGIVARRDLARMLGTMAHRAPDRQNSWSEGGVGLAHGLLRVNHEDVFDAQPVHDHAASLTLVADVRLDNRETLADALAIPEAALARLSDSALLLSAYRRWDQGCVEHLVGDFAFAVWNGQTRGLFLARDHMGQRGVFFHRAAGGFAFASEIRALLTLPDVPRVLSEGAIARRLMWGTDWPAGETHLRGVVGLGGGRTLTIDSAGVATERVYWTPRADPVHEGRSESYYIATYRLVLAEAVACRLRRLTRAAALCMSGGFDSAAIAGLAGPIVTAQQRKLVGLSAAAPAGKGEADDPRPWIELCQRFMPHLDVRWYEGHPDALGDLEGAFLAADGPVGLGFHVDRHLFRLGAADGARLVMDGMGGDYTVNHRGDRALAYFLRSGRLGRFLREIGPHLRFSGHSAWRTLRRDVLEEVLPIGLLRAIRRARRRFAPAWMTRMVAADFARQVIARGDVDPDRVYEVGVSRNTMREECAEICRQTASFAPGERAMSAARVGLEHTRPFHDKRVVEFGMAIPEELYVKHGRNRYLACRALADVYPPEFQTRDRRQTSGAPDARQAVTAAQRHMLEEVRRLEAKPAHPRYVDFSKVRREIESLRWADGQPFPAVNALLLVRYVDWFAGDNS